MLSDISEEVWTTATPAEGWDVKDTIVHLVQADVAARLAVDDPDGFVDAKAKMMSGGGLEFFASTNGRSGNEILALW